MNLNTIKKDRMLRARKDIATGLMECGDCGVRFYYKEVKSSTQKHKNGEKKIYTTYYHLSRIKKAVCNQRPKSFKLSDVNEIFKLFYFYFYVVFDNTNDLKKESQRKIKQTQAKLKEKIDKSEKEISVIEKRIERFQRVMDKQETDDLVETLLRNIKTSEDKLNNLNIELSKLRIDYELENDKFNRNELEIAYYDVTERVNNWFFKLNIEEQRTELIKIVKRCLVFNSHLIIDAGKIVFLFDIKQHYVFDMKLLENMNKDVIYKDHFIDEKNKREVRKFNDKLIHNVNLNRDNETRMRVFQYLINEYEIMYDISEHTNFVPFVPITGLMTFEMEQFGTQE
jgi:hypothetical protein